MDLLSKQETPSISGFTLHFGRVLLAFLIFGLSDLVAGYLVPGPELGGSRESLILVALVLGHAALFGLMIGMILGLLSWVASIADPKRGHRLLGMALGLTTFFYLNAETFDGASIQGHPRLQQIRLGFYILGTLSIMFATWLGHWTMVQHGRDQTKSRGIAIIGLALAQVLLWQNVVQLSGLYWMLHAQLSVIAFLLILFGPVAWWLNSKTRMLLILALAVFLVVCTLFIRSQEIHSRVVSASLVRAHACGQFRSVTNKIFDTLVPAYHTSMDEIPIGRIPRSSKEDRRLAVEWFQKHLGDTSDYNVLLVAVDTLRADHCGFLGYDKNPTTPNMDALAKESFVFVNAYSTYPTSNVSYSSILTGLLPRATPAYARIKRLERKFDPLTPTPSLFAARGYKTIGITAFNAQTAQNDNWFGLLRRGFDIYNPDQEEAQLSADKVTDSIIGQLKGVKERPFFLWGHYLDPHDPYLSRTGHDFGSSKLARYDADISWTDQEFGRLIDYLRSTKTLDKTILVLFSDHGEEFNEHGGWRHNSSVYQEQIHVPLLIRVPGVPGQQIDKVVSLVDIHPTLTALMGVDDPVKRHGQSLLPAMLKQENIEEGFAYAEHFYLVSRKDFDNKKALIHGSKKLIQFIQRESFEMYDIEEDPEERRNQVGRDNETFAQLAGLMAAIDEEIDSYHLKSGESAEEPRHAFRRRMGSSLDDLLSSDVIKAQAAFKELRSQMFLALGELSPNAMKHFTAGERQAMALRMARAATKIKAASQRNNVMKLLCLFDEPQTYKTVEQFFEDPSYPVRFSAALGLGYHGVKAAQPYLQVALRSNLADPSKIAVALARLGDPQAGPWVVPALLAPAKSTVGEMILHLPYIQVPNMGFYVRDVLTEGRWHTRMAQGALAKSLATMTKDPDLRWLLFFLTGNSGTAVRKFAEESLIKAGVSREEIASRREAVDLEVDGCVEIKNRVYDQAFQSFRSALAKNDFFNPGLRFRLARYLHLQGQVSEARSLLEGIAAKAQNPLDQRLARRRLTLLEWPARIESPTEFGITISEVKIPDHWTPAVPAQFTIKIKNTGSTAIQGGFWQYPANLTLGWMSDDGQVLPQDVTWDNFLPQEGLLPGEEIVIPLVGLTPNAKNLEARAFIRFEQPGLELEDPKIYIHDRKSKIGKVAH